MCFFVFVRLIFFHSSDLDTMPRKLGKCTHQFDATGAADFP